MGRQLLDNRIAPFSVFKFLTDKSTDLPIKLNQMRIHSHGGALLSTFDHFHHVRKAIRLGRPWNIVIILLHGNLGITKNVPPTLRSALLLVSQPKPTSSRLGM